MSKNEIKKYSQKNLTHFLSINNKTQKDLVDYTGINLSILWKIIGAYSYVAITYFFK